MCATKLIIVESPAKCKTISKILGSDYRVIATMEHIRDLPKNKMGIDIDKKYKPHYQISPDKKKSVQNIIDLSKKSKEIFIATDEDREGEAIGWHVVESAKLEVTDVINQLHKWQANDNMVTIRDMAEIQDAIKGTVKTISLLLGIVATIALLVGGIGIMNIMLVSVTERTREIGLRKAIGAGKKDIMNQFLVEAVIITVVGGIFGVLLGWLISILISFFAKWATEISLVSVFVSTGFSIIIGLIFGLWPAKQAANLKTIDALRYE